jgi:glutathione synthase/RimK-type ligase-like ATP-grasp enzyme
VALASTPERQEVMTGLCQAQRPLLIVGAGGDPRVTGFQAARARAGLPLARLLDYRDLVADFAGSASALSGAAVVRIDSPGRDPNVLAGMLALGIERCVQDNSMVLSRSMIADVVADRGRLLPAYQLCCGLQVVLEALQGQAQYAKVQNAKEHNRDWGAAIKLIPDPASILLAFDKARCHAHLHAQGILVPTALATITSFEDLLAKMRVAALSRVFIKLRHGSAAAGTVALATSSSQGLRAISTVEMMASADGVRLYNTRDIRTYVSPREIATLIDALVPYGLHVEAWIPKAGVGGKVADLRVLVIDGEPALRVLRKSDHAITNLHLGGQRADADGLLSQMSAGAVAALDETCRRVARAFPGALHLGIDIAVAAGLKRHYVLEVNAFGDLLNGITRDGLDAYDLQVRAMERAA